MPADRQVRRPIEEVLRVVHFGRFFGQLLQVQRRYFEHLAGTFAVAGGNDRSVDVQESLPLKIVVNRARYAISHACHRAERVGAGPQVSPFTQLLERVPFFLQRVEVRIRPAMHDHFRRLNFGGLVLAAGRLYFTTHRNATPRSQFLDLGIVVGQLGVTDGLNVGHATAVIQFQETKATFRVAPRPHPTLQFDPPADGSFLPSILDTNSVQKSPPCGLPLRTYFCGLTN